MRLIKLFACVLAAAFMTMPALAMECANSGAAPGAVPDDTADGNATACGSNSVAGGNDSTALGYAASSAGTESNALGYLASAAGIGSTALGRSASAPNNFSTALGAGATRQSRISKFEQTNYWRGEDSRAAKNLQMASPAVEN